MSNLNLTPEEVMALMRAQAFSTGNTGSIGNGANTNIGAQLQSLLQLTSSSGNPSHGTGTTGTSAGPSTTTSTSPGPAGPAATSNYTTSSLESQLLELQLRRIQEAGGQYNVRSGSALSSNASVELTQLRALALLQAAQTAPSAPAPSAPAPAAQASVPGSAAAPPSGSVSNLQLLRLLQTHGAKKQAQSQSQAQAQPSENVALAPALAAAAAADSTTANTGTGAEHPLLQWLNSRANAGGMTASTPAAAAASVLNNSGSGDVNDQVDLQASIARFLMLQQQRNQLHQQDQEEDDRKQPAIGHHHMQTSRPSPPASALTSMSASAPTLPPPALSALEACRRLGLSASQAPALAAAMAVAQGDNGNATHSRSTYAPQAATTNAPSTQLAALLQLARGTISNTSTAPEEPPEGEDQDSVEGAEKGKPRKGRAIKFPATLHSILCTIEQEGRGDVASFVPDGSGFIVHDPKAFVREYLSRHFKSSTFSSFQRQVNLYCFKRIKVGTDSIYKHPKFHRDHPGLVLEMTRTKIKNPKLAAAASARKMKRKQQQD